MAKCIHGARIDSRTARFKLEIRHEPHWIMITKGCFLGYRRRLGPGTWVARFRNPSGNHNYRALGGADDGQLGANGVNVLTFDQAAERAREWFQVAACTAPGEGKPGIYTVADCVADYLDFVLHHRKSHGASHHLRQRLYPPQARQGRHREADHRNDPQVGARDRD